MNDTGSDLLTLYDLDMPYLGNSDGYAGWLGIAVVRCANGTVDHHRILRVQVQMMGDGDIPWSDWISEIAIITPEIDGIPRLSGMGIRRVLFMATTPGNNFLAVSATKGGLVSLL